MRGATGLIGVPRILLCLEQRRFHRGERREYKEDAKKAEPIAALCREHNWQVIVGVEEDEPEDISDVEWLLGRVSDAAKADDKPHAPPENRRQRLLSVPQRQKVQEVLRRCQFGVAIVNAPRIIVQQNCCKTELLC